MKKIPKGGRRLENTFQRSSPEVTHMRKSIQTSIRRHPVVTHIRCEQAMTQEMTHHQNIAKSIHTSIHQRHPRPHHQVLCFVTWDQIATASSSRAPAPGPKAPSGPPKNIRKAIPAPPQIPQRSYAEASSKAAGAVPASAATSDAEILGDSNAKVAEDLCREFQEEDIVSVLTNALKVFMPTMGVWQALQAFDKPQGVIEFLLNDKGMHPQHLREMLIATIQPRLDEQSIG